MMDDLISRQAAIDAMTNTLWHYPNECYRNLNEYEFAKGLSELGLKSVPSAQLYSEADIQKMQDLEQAEIQKAYELGKLDAEPQWIPCSERLPDDLSEVNVTWVNHNPVSYYEFVKDKPFSATAVYYKGKWYWWTQYTQDLLAEYGERCNAGLLDKDVEITAWMPLPEPYREEGENG